MCELVLDQIQSSGFCVHGDEHLGYIKGPNVINVICYTRVYPKVPGLRR
jgi:hypothetical protein